MATYSSMVRTFGTTGDYSLQALNIAQAGAAADVSTADQWLPLGVFCDGA